MGSAVDYVRFVYHTLERLVHIKDRSQISIVEQKAVLPVTWRRFINNVILRNEFLPIHFYSVNNFQKTLTEKEQHSTYDNMWKQSIENAYEPLKE